jgi:hypothetical protein
MIDADQPDREAARKAAWAEMQRHADEFVAPREARLWTESMILVALPACHGNGHVGAI